MYTVDYNLSKCRRIISFSFFSNTVCVYCASLWMFSQLCDCCLCSGFLVMLVSPVQLSYCHRTFSLTTPTLTLMTQTDECIFRLSCRSRLSICDVTTVGQTKVLYTQWQQMIKTVLFISSSKPDKCYRYKYIITKRGEAIIAFFLY